MIRFYTNQELSRIFDINLARLKRWSREFLPPDPLGGLQSGYARQYNLDDAFTLFLGGHLVGDLKFSIAETRQILGDLHQWLVDHDFYIYFSKSSESDIKQTSHVDSYQIAVTTRATQDDKVTGLSYYIKGLISDGFADYHGARVRREYFVESFIKSRESEPLRNGTESYRVLNISGLQRKFLNYLQD